MVDRIDEEADPVLVRIPRIRQHLAVEGGRCHESVGGVGIGLHHLRAVRVLLFLQAAIGIVSILMHPRPGSELVGGIVHHVIRPGRRIQPVADPVVSVRSSCGLVRHRLRRRDRGQAAVRVVAVGPTPSPVRHRHRIARVVARRIPNGRQDIRPVLVRNRAQEIPWIISACAPVNVDYAKILVGRSLPIRTIRPATHPRRALASTVQSTRDNVAAIALARSEQPQRSRQPG